MALLGGADWAGLIAAVLLLPFALAALFLLYSRRQRPQVEEAKPLVCPTLPPPAILPASGTFPPGCEITIVPPPNAGAYVRCALKPRVRATPFVPWDGSTATLTIPGWHVIQAFSHQHNCTDSAVVTAMIEVKPDTPPTTEIFFSHSAGTYPAPFDLVLWHPFPAPIYYTTDHFTDPWAGRLYTGPIPIEETTEVRAELGGCEVPCTVRRYVVEVPVTAPGIAVLIVVEGQQRVYDVSHDEVVQLPAGARLALRSTTPGSLVLFSLLPYAAAVREESPSQHYTSPMTILPGQWWLSTMAVKAGLRDSPITRRVVVSSTPPPVLDPPPGEYTAPLAVTVSHPYPDTFRVRYSLDGRAPAVGGTASNAPARILLHHGAHALRAVAFNGSDVSKEVSGLYKVKGPGVEPPDIYPKEQQHCVGAFPFVVVVSPPDPACDVALLLKHSSGEEDHLTLPKQGEVYISLYGSHTVQARSRSRETGLLSMLVTQRYELRPPSPCITPSGGLLREPAHFTITCEAPPHINVLYSDDGGPPTRKAIRGADIPLSPSTVHVAAVAVDPSTGVSSSITRAVFQVEPLPQAVAPSFAPSRCVHQTSRLEVHLSCPTPRSTIYYKMTTSKKEKKYRHPIVLAPADMTADGDVSIAAWAVAKGHMKSDVVQKIYVVSTPAPPPKPSLSCCATELAIQVVVDDGLTAFYSLDGLSPHPGREGVVQADLDEMVVIPSKGTTVLKVISCDGDGRCSAVTECAFVEGGPAVCPSTAQRRGDKQGTPPPPTLLAHARAVRIFASCSDNTATVRYAIASPPDATSAIFPPGGLLIPASTDSLDLRVASFGPFGASSEVVEKTFHRVTGWPSLSSAGSSSRSSVQGTADPPGNPDVPEQTGGDTPSHPPVSGAV